MNKNRPLIVTFIGDISILCALLSIAITLFPDFSADHGVKLLPIPFFSTGITGMIMPVIFLIISLGFLRMKKWGYWLMIFYNVCFAAVAMLWGFESKQVSGYIFTILELIFIIPTRNYFYKEHGINNTGG